MGFVTALMVRMQREALEQQSRSPCSSPECRAKAPIADRGNPCPRLSPLARLAILGHRRRAAQRGPASGSRLGPGASAPAFAAAAALQYVASLRQLPPRRWSPAAVHDRVGKVPQVSASGGPRRGRARRYGTVLSKQKPMSRVQKVLQFLLGICGWGTSGSLPRLGLPTPLAYRRPCPRRPAGPAPPDRRSIATAPIPAGIHVSVREQVACADTRNGRRHLRRRSLVTAPQFAPQNWMPAKQAVRGTGGQPCC